VDVKEAQQWDSRGNFFAAAAEAMRRILVDQARRKRSRKHGGDRERLDLDSLDLVLPEIPEDLVALDEALNKLAATDKVAADLVHLREHVIDIHAVRDDAPVPYLVMEYIEGCNLEALLRKGGLLEVKEVLRIGLQVARGLAAAQKQGLIHGDVEPADILLENGMRPVKLTNFDLKDRQRCFSTR
jgi:serine/threonine protein kinase